MATCDRCGAFVSTDFARVFGKNDGTIDGCLDCTEGRVVGGETTGSGFRQPRRAHVRASA
jgi:hypothetical protein